MKRNSALALIALLLLTLVDYVTKEFALRNLSYLVNPGLILGLFSDLPPFLLIISLSSVAAFFFLVFTILQLFLNPTLLGLKLGISFLVSGVFGNVIDKALRVGTIDWIPFPWFGSKSVMFNLSDTFLWIGVGTILWWLFRKDEILWYPGDQRRRVWHDPKEQLNFAYKFVAIVFGICGMVGFFSYVYIQQILAHLPAHLSENLGSHYLVVLGSMSLLFMLVAFMIGIWISHQLMGPIVGFERHVEEIMSGKQKEFKLREGDMFKRLEEIATLITKLSLILFPLTLTLDAFAYPQYIGLQYTSCLTCHYNPQGNGPLNDYGRGVAATAIAGRMGVGKNVSEEELVKSSAFPGINPEKNTWLRPMIGYRGLGLDRNAFTGRSDKSFIQMQMDASLTLKAGQRDQYIMSFTYGTRPVNRAEAQNLMESKGYSREHYIGWRPTPKFGVYAGKMDKAFGLRIPDHNLSSRVQTRTAQFNQVHGVMLHAVGESVEASVHSFVGDLNLQNEDEREKGYSGILEWGVTSQNRLGVSYQASELGNSQQQVIALHDRIGLGKGHSVMGELGQITRTIGSAESQEFLYGLMQTHLMVTRGLWLTGTFDYFKSNVNTTSETLSAGPGIQWFPRQKVEFRLDIYNRRVFQENLATQDSWQALAQVHLWL